MAKTFLYNNHINLGAKMVDFAGWNMPVQYTSIIEEHNNVRNKAGLFDVSHMGQIFVSGKDSIDFLQGLVPQDIEKIIDKKAKYCQFTNSNGGIIDDLFIYKPGENKYLLIVNASRQEIDYNWLVENKKELEVLIDNKSEYYSMLALQGPKSSDILAEAGISKVCQPHTMYIMQTKLLNEDVYISRTGYTGEDGFEIIIRNEKVIELWEMLLEKGKKYGIMPIGLGARDTLRLEAAMSLYGNDLTEETTPVEASLIWSIDKDKKQNYIGKSKIVEQLKNGVEKKLIAFKMIDKAIARHKYPIYFNNEEIGYVTSGGVAPFIGQNIGLGYIKTDKNLKINDTIQIMIRNKLYNAIITTRQFIQKHNKGN
ncbi:MAG: glycine cleavage system aminomethyltransferase GcvT [Candidatus Gastranaerophilales bacterium]|nr:glycine cleavage system aminomethyltransferase GcvT [Candidatus Gastranaerophilales bacterium]